MQLHTLGTLRLEGARFSQPKPLVLLSYLSLEGATARRHVAALFWPDGERMKSLSMALTRLHRGAGAVVDADRARVWGTVPSDARELLAALDAGDWQRASDGYRGAFLDGVVLDDWSVELEEWVHATREHLAERVQHALLKLAEEAAEALDFARAGRLAERAYRLPGLGGHDAAALERLHALLCASGSGLASAVRDEAAEFGLRVDPDRDAARAAFAAAGGRARDRVADLPLRHTSFVGRERELATLVALVERPEVALVTLMGPGGAGKTRLASQLAQRQRQRAEDPDGARVFFVPLESLRDAALLPRTLGDRFGLPPHAARDPWEPVAAFLAARPTLLVLDNFEHLVAEAAALARLVARCPGLKLLVTSRERLRLDEEHVVPLAGLAVPVDGDADGRASEAVRLFRERARQVRSDVDLDGQLADVVRICRLTEGLPLALELAASWVRVMSCADIADAVAADGAFLASSNHDAPDRHRSLTVVFDASWQRLSDEERAAMRKLSVFRGGFRREAAAAVAGADLALLAALVDASLVRSLPNGRYDRHPLLEQFSRARLEARPEERERAELEHARLYLGLVERAEPLLRGRDQVPWFGRLEEELDNARAALDRLERSDPRAALRLAAALGTFWEVRGHYREGYRRLEALLRRVPERNATRVEATLRAAQLLQKLDDPERAEALFEESLVAAGEFGRAALEIEARIGLGVAARFHRGDYGLARTRFEAAIAQARAAGEPSLAAHALRCLGSLRTERGEYRAAQSCHEESARLYDDLGDTHNAAKSLLSLATVLTYLGENDRSRVLNEESLALFRAVGDRHGEGVALLNLGLDASTRGDPLAGLELYGRSLALFRDLGDERMVSHLLNNVAGVHQKESRPHDARPLLDESLAIQRRLGDVSLICHALFILGQVHDDLAEPSDAERCYRECIDLCRRTDETWTLMRVLEASARWHLAQRDLAAARAAVDEAVGLARRAGDRATLDRALATKASIEVDRASGSPS